MASPLSCPFYSLVHMPIAESYPAWYVGVRTHALRLDVGIIVYLIFHVIQM